MAGKPARARGGWQRPRRGKGAAHWGGLATTVSLAHNPVTRETDHYCVYFLVISIIIFFPNVVLWLPRLIVPTSVGCFPNPSGGGYICPQ